ncbi:hypothetical protein ACFPL7_14765 [Dongia soli]|uniref:Uncharacterized protein n=1 Tax=Dongia soli TaxID=600628 RepID=A0ABU5EBT7_9PROT|nr:hypothetical protein [Dongia soli]MDY0883840.1 hypothetical protein [Dongia soli]
MFQRKHISRFKEELQMSLQAKLDAFKADFEAGEPPYSVPRSVIETMHRTTGELIASGAAERALGVGDKAPSFTLKDPGILRAACAGAARNSRHCRGIQGQRRTRFARGFRWC